MGGEDVARLHAEGVVCVRRWAGGGADEGVVGVWV